MGEVRVTTVEQKERTLLEKSYIPEIVKGLGVTMKHFFQNLGFDDEKDSTFTTPYPDEKREYPDRYRGQHRLMVRDDGQVRCVACMCCSTLCPADCIHIEAAEHDDPSIEKYPEVFVIDELRCIACGLCVEACPCDAIRMDTGEHVEAFGDRGDAFYERDHLMELGGQSLAEQGGQQVPTDTPGAGDRTAS
ncbi:MAG: NADH-quinone oxidoreductase subunit I [Bradymonadaceae bacterium]